MGTAREWLELAESSGASGATLAERDPRSATSRFYFAAYQAAHAIALGAGLAPPARGNWSHLSLPAAAYHALVSALGQGKTAGNMVRRRLETAQRARVFADYVAEPGALQAQSVAEARKAAAALCAAARKVVAA